jgi:hypothetical protein
MPPNTTIPVGLLLLLCTAIHLIPKTSILGAILITGYLGGAIAIQLRAAAGAFPIIFSAAFAVLIWVGLVLREPRLGPLILLRLW